jgi:hypothetical protein
MSQDGVGGPAAEAADASKTQLRGVLCTALLASLAAWRAAAGVTGRGDGAVAAPALRDRLGYGLDEVRDLLLAHPAAPAVRDPVDEALVAVGGGAADAGAAGGRVALTAGAAHPVTTLWSTNALIATALHAALQPCVRAVVQANPAAVDASAAVLAAASASAGGGGSGSGGPRPSSAQAVSRSLFDLAALLGPHNEVSTDKLARIRLPPLTVASGGRAPAARPSDGGGEGEPSKRARVEPGAAAAAADDLGDDVVEVEGAGGSPVSPSAHAHAHSGGDAAVEGIRTTRGVGAGINAWQTGQYDSDLDVSSGDGEGDDAMAGGPGGVGRAVSSADRRRDSWLGSELADVIAAGAGGSGDGQGAAGRRGDEEGGSAAGGCAVM